MQIYICGTPGCLLPKNTQGFYKGDHYELKAWLFFSSLNCE
jgi:hypothetical protein